MRFIACWSQATPTGVLLSRCVSFRWPSTRSGHGYSFPCIVREPRLPRVAALPLAAHLAAALAVSGAGAPWSRSEKVASIDVFKTEIGSRVSCACRPAYPWLSPSERILDRLFRALWCTEQAGSRQALRGARSCLPLQHALALRCRNERSFGWGMISATFLANSEMPSFDSPLRSP